MIESAQKSPVYRFAKEWKLGLPLHVEYRTFPMLFYVPPLLPVMSISDGDLVRSDVDELFADIEKARAPIGYLGQLFAAGNEGKVRYALRKQLAVRIWRRHVTVGDLTRRPPRRPCTEADCTPEQADEIYRLSALATWDDRFVIPPFQREMAMEMMTDPHEHRSSAGFGFRDAPTRS